MRMVTVEQAKSTLPQLIKLIESGETKEIIIYRNGQAVAKLVALDELAFGKRIGIAKGMLAVPETIDANNKLVDNLFLGSAE